MSTQIARYWKTSPMPQDRPVLVKGMLIYPDGCVASYLGLVEYNEEAEGWVIPADEDKTCFGPSSLSPVLGTVLTCYCWIDLPERSIWAMNVVPCGNPPSIPGFSIASTPHEDDPADRPW